MNSWSQWAQDIKNEIESTRKRVGDREDAYFLPSFAKKLIDDMPLFPLWSCVCQEKFGYARIPASSAPVEGEFSKTKNVMLKGVTRPLRVDSFIQRHIQYINGKMKIIDAANASHENLIDLDNKVVQEEHSIDEPAGQKNDIDINKLHDSMYDSTAEKKIVEDPITSNEVCPACARGDEPGGAHSCVSCHRFVHALEQCSIAVNKAEEGHGQSRICTKCYFSTPPVEPEIKGSQKFENWRGLITNTKRKRKSLYLGESTREIKDALTWEKHKSISIMKNGNSMKLQAVQIGKHKYSLTKTCAFDSLFQIILAGTSDYSALRELVQISQDQNDLYDLVEYTIRMGMTSHCYHKRTEIMVKIFPVQSEDDLIKIIDCDTNVGVMAIKIFNQTPSITEKVQCRNGCPQKTFTVPVGSLSDYNLVSGNLTESIKRDIFLIGPRQCQIPECNGIASYDEGIIDPRTKGFSGEPSILDENDYSSVWSLAKNTEKRSSPDLFGRSFNAVFILYCVATMTNFLGEKLPPDINALRNNPWSIFLGGLITTHQQIIPSNVHSVTETKGIIDRERGASMIPFLSLFNHSCDCMVMRIHYGRQVVLYALRPIEAGEQVYDNYGMHYAVEDLDSRQRRLQKQFFFNCECRACRENWPMFSEIASWTEKGLDRNHKKEVTTALANFNKYVELATNGNVEDKPYIVKDLESMIKVLFDHVDLPCREVNEVVETLKRVYALLSTRYHSLSDTLK